MKRKFGILAAGLMLGVALGGVGCKDDKLRENVEYRYDGVSFKHSKGLTLEDLQSIVPTGQDFRSLDDFEDFIEDNLDTYSIAQSNGAGETEQIYLKTDISSIKLKGDEFIIKRKDAEEKCSYERSGNDFLVDKQGYFYFRDGEFHFERVLYQEAGKEFKIVYEFDD